MHDAPVLPPPLRVSYLAADNAKRVEQLQWVTLRMAFTVGFWTTKDPEDIDDDFAALWGLTCWFCGLQLPQTVDDFWRGPSVLERNLTPPPQHRNDRSGQAAKEGTDDAEVDGRQGANRSLATTTVGNEAPGASAPRVEPTKAKKGA